MYIVRSRDYDHLISSFDLQTKKYIYEKINKIWNRNKGTIKFFRASASELNNTIGNLLTDHFALCTLRSIKRKAGRTKCPRLCQQVLRQRGFLLHVWISPGIFPLQTLLTLNLRANQSTRSGSSKLIWILVLGQTLLRKSYKHTANELHGTRSTTYAYSRDSLREICHLP